MPLPQTKVSLAAALAGGKAYRFLPNAAGDFAGALTGAPAPSWLSTIADLDGDGRADFVLGAPGDDDKAIDAGRVFVYLDPIADGASVGVADGLNRLIIDGVNAGDRAGAAVGSIGDLDGDGKAEILVGAPGMNNGAAGDAGAAFVIWGGGAPGGVDLNDPFTASGGGYAIKGQAAGDAAGTSVMSITDLNGDGKADVIVGAPGNDGGGIDAGAVYVVWGKATDTVVSLSTVAAGTGGFKIVGEDGGDAIGATVGVVSDLNGDGKSEILIGAPDSNAGGSNSGAVYVVFGKSTGTAVDLTDVAAGTGGFRIKGVAQDDAGAAVAGIGDVNGDGKADILIGAPRSDSAYVVFGKADTAEVDLANVSLGVGGYRIVAEDIGDLDSISVVGGADLNSDGVGDIVIGAQNNAEGGSDAGAVYIVWGGGAGTVDLSLVAQGIGGAKIVGAAGSLTGASVSIAPDLNNDGVSDLMIGAAGLGESAYALFSDPSWLPDLNIYGTNGADVIAAGYGGMHVVGATDDAILALAGDDTVNGGAGNDTIEGGAGNDTLNGEQGDDTLDGGIGADSMNGGVGDDLYLVDSNLDAIAEAAGEGVDTVFASVNHTLAANVENLVLSGLARVGSGNADANVIAGSSGNDTLDGKAGADTLIGGLGDDRYIVDDVGDLVTEAASAGIDRVTTSVDYTLAADVEHLVLTGAAHLGVGNGSSNSITGGGGNDSLDGAGGADALAGGLGDDVYVVDNAGDSVVEAADAGIDAVLSSVDRTLGANVENLTLTGSARLGVGNGLANVIVGGAGDDTLDGAGGADTLIGGLGDDRYGVDSASDVIVEAAGGGNDTIVATVDYTLADASIENLTLAGAAHIGVGNAEGNRIVGGSGDDTLDGAGGDDILTGGAGNDRYVVDSAGDAVVELAGGGVDIVVSAVDATLSAEVENLLLSGAGAVGVGNALANALTGSAGAQSLFGGDGDDSLDGGLGADTMTGGAGDDTFVIDDLGDVVVEDAGGGVDLIVSAFNVTSIADNIEAVRLTGTAHVAVGNAGSNRLSGDVGDDTLDGGDGDDLELGGAGDDTLVSHSGVDTLSGGVGDDCYVVAGGVASIEDFLGHDTIDASGSSADCYIDLSGETDSEIENEICHLGQGGTTAAPLDVQFLQDLSGSFGDDIATVRSLVPSIVSALQGVQADSRFGASSFIDKPVSPFGAVGEWVYQTELGLTANAAALTATYNSLVIRNGADAPEAQLEGLMQLALHSADIGFRADSARFVVLFTDAPFHQAGDGAAAGILTPNNGDNLTPGGGALEDYPLIAQVKAALAAANIIPIFAIAGGNEPVYQGLVSSLGRGAIVTLSADSSNVVAAITSGLTAATTTHIEDAIGGAGNDTLKGGLEGNHLWGRDGADSLDGGVGNDTLDGEAGNDSVAGGAGNDALNGGVGDDILAPGSGVDVVAGGLGNDMVRADYSALAAGVTIVGSTGSGTILAGSDTVVFSGIERRDVRSGDGADLLRGGAGDDTLDGGGAGDKFYGSDGADSLYGGAGADMLNGGLGADFLAGGADADVYYVDNLGDLLDETSVGSSGIDTVFITVNDYLVAAGVERASVSGAAGLTVSAAGDTNNIMVGASGNDALDGGDGADSIYGNAGHDLLTGGLGDDKLYGHDGIDSLRGGDGSDVLDGGLGADVLVGGLGNDTYFADNASDLIDESNPGSGGVDIVFAAGDSLAVGEGVERVNVTRAAGSTVVGQGAFDHLLNGGNGADRLEGGLGADRLYGNGGLDLLDGGGDNDKLFGGAGDDSLLGGEGVDTLEGGAGADFMAGGAGSDYYYADSLGDLLDETSAGSSGVDTVFVSAAGDYHVGEGVERANASGAAGRTITADGATDNLIYGAGFGDRLDGGAGSDKLYGGDGIDVLLGGAGADTMTGGAGADVFVKGVGEGADRIADFATGVDVVDLVGLTVASGLGSTTVILSDGSSLVAGNGHAWASLDFI